MQSSHQAGFEAHRVMGKGRPRRAKVPEIDQEHLVDTFLSHVKSVGEAAAFNLGQYKHLDAAQGSKVLPWLTSCPYSRCCTRFLLRWFSSTVKSRRLLVFKYSQVQSSQVQSCSLGANDPWSNSNWWEDNWPELVESEPMGLAKPAGPTPLGEPCFKRTSFLTCLF